MRYDEPTCDHEFIREEPFFVFEDVLVNEVVECNREHCSEEAVRQFEVDFDSFVVDGADITDEETAYDYWDRICDEVGEYDDFYSKSGGNVVTIEYDDNDHITTVTVELEDTEVKFDVEFYRDLS